MAQSLDSFLILSLMLTRKDREVCFTACFWRNGQSHDNKSWIKMKALALSAHGMYVYVVLRFEVMWHWLRERWPCPFDSLTATCCVLARGCPPSSPGPLDPSCPPSQCEQAALKRQSVVVSLPDRSDRRLIPFECVVLYWMGTRSAGLEFRHWQNGR